MQYKYILPALLCAVGVMAEDKANVDTWDVSGRLEMYVQSIDMKGESNSTKEGNTHQEVLNLNLSGPLLGGEAGLQIRARATNDEKIQKDGSELLYLRSFLKQKEWSFEAGDVAASWNSYVFNGSLKGLKAEYVDEEKKKAWDYGFIGGFKKKSWRDTYTQDENEEPTSYVGAFLAKYRHERAKELSLSMSAFKDDLSTGTLTANTTGKKGLSFGLDTSWRFNRYITLKGKGAVSRGTDDLENDKPNETNTALLLKLLTRPDLKSLRSNFKYERIDSDFVSFGGNANDDKEVLENSSMWTINRQLRARVDLKMQRDNLDGSLEDTMYRYYEALSFAYRPEFIKRGNFNLKFSNQDRDGRGTDNNRKTARIDFNLRQKDGWRYGLGYDYSDYSDKINGDSSRESHNYKILLAYKQKLDDESGYRISTRVTYRNIVSTEDKIGFKIDAGYDYNKKLAMDLMYMINGRDQETGDDSKNSTYQFRTSYKLDSKGQNILRFLMEKRDVDVDNNPSGSYDEYRARLALTMNF